MPTGNVIIQILATPPSPNDYLEDLAKISQASERARHLSNQIYDRIEALRGQLIEMTDEEISQDIPGSWAALAHNKGIHAELSRQWSKYYRVADLAGNLAARAFKVIPRAWYNSPTLPEYAAAATPGI